VADGWVGGVRGNVEVFRGVVVQVLLRAVGCRQSNISGALRVVAGVREEREALYRLESH